MKRIIMSLVLAATALGCAGVFDKCVAPEIKNIEHAAPATLGEEVAMFLLCDPNFNAGAVPACAEEGLAALLAALGPGGRETIDCIVSYWTGAGSPTLQARARAVAVKRGIRASMVCPGVTAAVAKLSDPVPVVQFAPLSLKDEASMTGTVSTTSPLSAGPNPYFHPFQVNLETDSFCWSWAPGFSNCWSPYESGTGARVQL